MEEKNKKNKFKSASCPKCNNVFSVPEKNLSKPIKCPLCGSIIPQPGNQPIRKIIDKIRHVRSSQAESPKWYHRLWFAIFMLFVYPFAGLIFLFISPTIKRWQKIAITIIVVFIFMFNYINSSSNYSFYQSPMQMISDVFYSAGEDPHLPVLANEPDNINYYDYSRIGIRQGYLLSTKDIATLFKPSVVQIYVYDNNRNEKGVGTGFIISKDGFIITNYHVIRGAYHAKIVLDNGLAEEDVYWAKSYLGASIDLALLKINTNDLRPVLLGDSDKIQIGEDIIVIGSPLGLEGSVSKGVVSEVRDIGKIELIQITAPISPGNSGGPVFNERGEVIGVATLASKFGEAQNINFAIPINYLKYPIYYQNPKSSKELGKMAEEVSQAEEQLKLLAANIKKQSRDLTELKSQVESATLYGDDLQYQELVNKYEELRQLLQRDLNKYRTLHSKYSNLFKKMQNKYNTIKPKEENTK